MHGFCELNPIIPDWSPSWVPGWHNQLPAFDPFDFDHTSLNTFADARVASHEILDAKGVHSATTTDVESIKLSSRDTGEAAAPEFRTLYNRLGSNFFSVVVHNVNPMSASNHHVGHNDRGKCTTAQLEAILAEVLSGDYAAAGLDSTEKPEIERAPYDELRLHAQYSGRGRSIGEIDASRYVLAGAQCQPADVLAVLLRLTTPNILHSVGDGHYIIVGTASAHGYITARDCGCIA